MFFYGFRFVNGPLLEHFQCVPARARDADRLSDLFDRLSDWPGRARPGRPLGALFALQEHLVREPGKRARGGGRTAAAPPPARSRSGAGRHGSCPEVEEFDIATASDFSVEGVIPPDDPPADEAGRGARRDGCAAARSDGPGRDGRIVASEIRSGRGRRHRDHRGAARAPCPCGTQGQADPAAAAPQPADADRRAGGDPASVCCNGAPTVVRYFPQTASLFSMLGMPVNLRGLIFQEVKSKSEFHDGVMVLVVEGVIVNLTRSTLEVPRLRFGLRNGTGHEVYAWTALPSRTLARVGRRTAVPHQACLAAAGRTRRDRPLLQSARCRARHTVRVSLADFR